MAPQLRGGPLMSRVYIYEVDDTDYGDSHRTLAGWFDVDKAERFGEETRWNGENQISVNSGSQWEHEALYRTAQGRWVLHWWSQWQGTLPSYRFVSDERARE